MRKVKPNHVHTGFNQASEHFFAFACWTNRGDNLCSFCGSSHGRHSVPWFSGASNRTGSPFTVHSSQFTVHRWQLAFRTFEDKQNSEPYRSHKFYRSHSRFGNLRRSTTPVLAATANCEP